MSVYCVRIVFRVMVVQVVGDGDLERGGGLCSQWELTVFDDEDRRFLLRSYHRVRKPPKEIRTTAVPAAPLLVWP